MHLHVQCKPTMRRSREFAEAFQRGLKVHGDTYVTTSSHLVNDVDGIVAYSSRHEAMFDQYKIKGKFTIFADLGYWGRKNGGCFNLGCHRVIVNGLHPNKYFRQDYPSDRWDETGFQIEDWKENKDGPILLMGNSTKASELYNIPVMQWEKDTLKEIRKYSDREVIFFRKLNPGVLLEGTTDGSSLGSFDNQLSKAWMVVSHHSNAGLFSLMKGIPIYNKIGISKDMGITDIRYIEFPQHPNNRKQFFSDVAYTQWSMFELEDGTCWKHIKKEVLPRCV